MNNFLGQEQRTLRPMPGYPIGRPPWMGSFFRSTPSDDANAKYLQHVLSNVVAASSSAAFGSQPPAMPDVSRGRPRQALALPRTREANWIAQHREELAALVGEWIVVEGDRLVSHSVDPVQAITDARRQGVAVPYLILVDLADHGSRFGL